MSESPKPITHRPLLQMSLPYLIWAFLGSHFDVIAPMIMKFGTDMKLDIFYTMSTKFVTSRLLRNYDAVTCVLSDV